MRKLLNKIKAVFELPARVEKLEKELKELSAYQTIIRETIDGPIIVRVFKDEETGEEVRQTIQESRRLPKLDFKK
jgi:hypothetical protein